MRLENIAQVLKPDAAIPEVAPGPGADDWLTRVNTAIKNFKDLIEVARQFKGVNGEPIEPTPTATLKEIAPKTAPGIADYVRLLIQAGYGDTPIGQLIEKVSPHTVKQIVELLKNAKP